MAQCGQRKCLCCSQFFDVDHRNRNRQRYCSVTACRRASKAASQAAWLTQPKNTTYFSHPVHVARVQAWRVAHPGYSRAKPVTTKPLQDPLFGQVVVFVEETPIRAKTPVPGAVSALQDLLNAPSPVLAGLIAHLFEVTLQDDIASTTRRLIQLGHDVINRSRDEDRKTCAAP